MNVFLVPEKRVRAVRERLVASKRVTLEQEMAQTAVMNAELETAVKIAQDLAAGMFRGCAFSFLAPRHSIKIT